jgi:hypothetical protein
MSGVEHGLGDLRMAVGTGELEHRVGVAAQAQPVEAVEDRVDRGIRRAGAVGVLDTQKIGPAMVTGIEPVEQGCARAADMQETGGRRGKPGNDTARWLGAAWPTPDPAETVSVSLAIEGAFLPISAHGRSRSSSHRHHAGH